MNVSEPLAAAEYPTLLTQPETTGVYLAPKLVTLEHTVVALYLTSGLARRLLLNARTQLTQYTAIGQRRLVEYQLDMLELMMLQYVPALMELGVQVRTCYWALRENGTGDVVRLLLGKYYLYLTRLDAEGSFEYARSILVALLSWTPLHSHLPAYAFVEECLEAGLSKLARASAAGCRFDSAADMGAVYCGHCRASGEPRDLTEPRLSQRYVAAVEQRLRELVQAILEQRMPHLGGTGYVQKGSLQWPPTFGKPEKLLTPGGVDHKLLLLRALSLLVAETTTGEAQLESVADVDGVLCSGMPKPSEAVVRLQNAAIDRVVAAYKAERTRAVVRRGKRRRTEAAVAVQPAAAVPVVQEVPALVVSADEPSVDAFEERQAVQVVASPPVALEALEDTAIGAVEELSTQRSLSSIAASSSTRSPTVERLRCWSPSSADSRDMASSVDSDDAVFRDGSPTWGSWGSTTGATDAGEFEDVADDEPLR